MKKLKRFLLFLILVAVAAAAGYRVWSLNKAKEQADSAPGARTVAGRTVSVSLAEARKGKVRDEVEITGALKPKEQVDVSSKVTGRVTQIAGEVGSFVKRGEVIASLEDAELVQQVRRAEAASAVVRATLQQRRAELGSAKADVDRAKQLLDAGLIARQDYDAKVTSYRVFQAQVALTEAQGDQAAAELRELKIQQEQTNIQAPISGFVAQRFVDVGAIVSPTTPVVRLVNLSTLVTVANVPERQVGKLRQGMRALVHVDAFGETAFDGKVARIAPVLDPATRTAFVEVEIPNRNNLLRAEMFARVTLELPTMRDAVLIPRESVVYRGNQAGVFVVEQKRPTFRPVETGTAQGQQVEVTSIDAGTRIVGRGASMVNDGDQLKIMEQTEAERNEAKPSSGTKLSQTDRPLASLTPAAAVSTL
jgi:membrane fusion protein (multidrug efflux system)